MKLDGKFFGEIYKNKNGERVPDDQWIVFLAKDDAVPHMLSFYITACLEVGAEIEQVKAAKELKDRVMKWREANPDLCRAPDVEPYELFKEHI